MTTNRLNRMGETRAMTVCHGHPDQRILAVGADDAADEAAIDAILRSAGFIVQRCADMNTLCDLVSRGVGAILITENELLANGECLAEVLAKQPAWSDIPTIVISAITSGAESNGTGLHAVDRLNLGGSVMFVEKPIRRDILLLAVRSALTARARQYEVRDLLQQREHAERALRESEERLALALEAGGMGAWEWHIASGTVIWSPSMENLHGKVRGSFPGTYEAVQQDVHPADREIFAQNINAILRDRHKSSFQFRYRIVRPDDSVAWLETRGQLVRTAEGEAARMCGVCTDITARKQAEDELSRHRERLEELVQERTRELDVSHQQLRQAERMASMGTLAAGLGHDLGNLVFPLRIRVELMRSREVAPELRDDLESIHNAVQYLQRLANGLRHMAMDANETGIGIESTDLDEWWADVEPVFSNALGRGIKLVRQFESGLPRVAVATHSLAQAIFNLVQNANEAMANSGSGTVLIRAQKGPGQTVQICVRDDGPGMSADIRQRCLEPFFTTKVRGISTGLGLALVNGVVKRAGGTIDVNTQTGAGTEWTLTLPAMQSIAQHDGNGASQQAHAVVDLRDQRLSAFVAAMLRTLNFVPTANEAVVEVPDDVAVWITDRNNGMPAAAEDFVNANDRFAVLLNQEVEPPEHPRILHTRGPATSESIRRLLRELVQAKLSADSAA